MPTLETVQNNVDATFAQRYADVMQPSQEAYIAEAGTYFQTRWTHTSPPRHSPLIDGSITPDNLTDKPTDVATSTAEADPDLATMPLPARFKVDVYTKPGGQQGYVVCLEFEYNNSTSIDLWRRCVDSGNAPERDKGWHTVEADGASTLWAEQV